MTMRSPCFALCLALTLSPVSAAAQAMGTTTIDTAALQRLLAAEDARGRGQGGLDPLIAALKGTDTTLRRVAVRGLGRFQRPELGRLLVPYLDDRLPSVRAEAAKAIAQSLRRVRRGTTTADSAQLSVPEAAALLDALDRLSAGRSENAKDPRVSILEGIGELGSAAAAPRLRPYLADYDTTVAGMASATLTKWTGDSIDARPLPLAIRAEPLAEIFLRRDIRLRVTMAPSSGGGSFTVRLFPGEAPASVARVLRLVREGFYDGKVFQRVESNFVIQGGGPDANEYVGDAPFMRDELTWRAHARGTVGISARGRDTGDGQWFINLVDNPLLDHEYTIFGRIDGGRPVAERILEGDRIGRVEEVREP